MSTYRATEQINNFQPLAEPCQANHRPISDLPAALADKAFELGTAPSQRLNAVLRDAAAPTDVNVRQHRAAVADGLKRQVGDCGTALHVELLQLAAVLG